MSATTRFCITPSATDILTDSNVIGYFAQRITIPALTLRKKCLLRWGATFKAIGTDSTDTFLFGVYFGTAADNTGCHLAASAAVDLADNDVGAAWGQHMVYTYAGASSAIITGEGSAVAVAGGTVATKTYGATEAQLDLTADQILTAYCTMSVAAAANQARLDSLWCEVIPFAV